MHQERKILTTKEMKKKLRINADSTIWTLRKKDESFPVPVQIGMRRLGWYEDEITAWAERGRMQQ